MAASFAADPSIEQRIARPELLTLFRYWQGIRGGRRMPSRADLRPADMVTLLPRLMIFDVEHDPVRFRFRLVGTTIVRQRAGRRFPDPTGRYLDEVDLATPEFRDNAAAMLGRIVENQTPLFVETQRLYDGTKVGTLLSLGLPLSSNDVEVDKILVGQYPREGD